MFTIKRSKFHQLLNPLHVYCRLVEWGVRKRLARAICKGYGKVYRIIVV